MLKSDVGLLYNFRGNSIWIRNKGVFLCFHSNSSSFTKMPDALLALDNFTVVKQSIIVQLRSKLYVNDYFGSYEITATYWRLGKERENRITFHQVLLLSLGQQMDVRKIQNTGKGMGTWKLAKTRGLLFLCEMCQRIWNKCEWVPWLSTGSCARGKLDSVLAASGVFWSFPTQAGKTSKLLHLQVSRDRSWKMLLLKSIYFPSEERLTLILDGNNSRACEK